MRAEAKTMENFGTGWLESAYIKALESIEEEIINPEDFISEKDQEYSEGKVKKNIEYAKEMDSKFTEEDLGEKEQAKKLAFIMEAILHEQAELNEWLGPDVMTIKTSRYDDIVNGIDTVVEFGEENREAKYLGMAIDVTICLDLDKKIERIKDEIKEDKLAEVKYFRSGKTGYKGKLEGIPRVIIVVDCNTTKELIGLWSGNKNKELAGHPVQFQILEEILMQLESYREYAKRNKKDRLAEIYEKYFNVVDMIREDKMKTTKDSGVRDSGFNYFKRVLDNL